MKSQIVFIACFLAVASGVRVVGTSEDNIEYPSDFQYDTPSVNDEPSKPDKYTAPETELKTALAEEDEVDHTTAKAQGFCQWGIKIWYKPGTGLRCSCMKCTCQKGGKWDCVYHFAYCPYFFCGGYIYNPKTNICCCGKVYEKKSRWSCCGYTYYNTATSRCCNYYTVKAKNLSCPRYQV